MGRPSMRERYLMGASGWAMLAPLVAWLVVGLYAFFCRGEPNEGLVMTGVFVAPFVAYVLASWGSTLSFEIGTDGVITKRRAGRAHFIPYDAIESVRLESGWLTIRRRDGSETIYTGNPNPYSSVRSPAVHANLTGLIFEEIEAGRKAHARRTTEAIAASDIALHGEAMAALRGEDQSVDYRRAAPTELEALDRVLTNPHADERARGAAAVLMRVRDPSGARMRIAAAADDTASPRLHALFQAANEEEAGDMRVAAAFEKLRARDEPSS